MARPRKTAEELVPKEHPLEEIVEAEEAVEAATGETRAAEPASRSRGKKRGEKPAAKQSRASEKGTTRERKPIVRAARAERPRGHVKERRGVVVSSAMDKTIVVRVDRVKPDRRYKKVVRRSSKFHAHDERNEAKVGDVVRIVESRPLSKTKVWRLAEVVEQAR